METADLSQAENYDYLCSKIDMANFIDYTVFELYSANVDWPANNVRCWQSGNRKWRWMYFDGDGCFFRDWDVFANIVDTSDNLGPSNAASTLFFRRLLKSPRFVEHFRSRFASVMSHVLNYEHTGPVLATLSEGIHDEIPNVCNRFNFPTSSSVWQAHVAQIDAYLQRRNYMMEAQIEAFLDVVFHEEPVSFACYPNPFTDEIHLLVASEKQSSTELMVFDLMGRCLYSESLRLFDGVNQFAIRLNLASGVYVMRIGNQAQRIVKY